LSLDIASKNAAMHASSSTSINFIIQFLSHYEPIENISSYDGYPKFLLKFIKQFLLNH
jgi:hypothetical protein